MRDCKLGDMVVTPYGNGVVMDTMDDEVCVSMIWWDREQVKLYVADGKVRGEPILSQVTQELKALDDELKR